MGASEVVIKATGDDTGGAFFVAEVVLEAGFPGPPRHFHERLHETIYCRVSVLVGDCIEREPAAADLLEDLLGGRGPDERFGVVVVGLEVALDRCDQVRH